MYLKSIELSGFKSFAKKSSLEFNSRVSAIVGPNGSGKSNVAEAFRFVLGEQSIKSLRGKRGEDLIFNGAGGEARANRAAVKVVFDNSSKVFGIDFPEVSIERMVHRDGVNEYLINGSQVRLKDVLELLASAHIGASGHHIISQGEADKILNATPKERKSMIEDALGLKTYQYKRIESERKLKKTFENISQVESLRREIAPHLKYLSKQVEKVEKAEEIRQDLLARALQYFKQEETALFALRASIKAERAPIDAELSALSHESSEAKKLLGLESTLSSARENKDILTREIGKLEGLIAGEERTIESEKRRQASEETRSVALKDVEHLIDEVSLLASVESIITRLKAFIGSHRTEKDLRSINEAETHIKEYKEQIKSLEQELAAARTKETEIGEAEKAVFRTKALESELMAKLGTVKLREAELERADEEFKRLLAELGHLLGAEILQYKSAQPVEDLDRTEERRLIERQKMRLEDSGVSGGQEVMKEYKETFERDEFLAKELLDLEKSAESLRELIKELEERLSVEFKTGTEKINNEFNAFFSKMFGGGEAHLTLIKEKDEENFEEDEIKSEEGLDIAVSLPRKKIRGLQMLSGGERALTSIALLFAISQVNPPPFVILDETDAALDEANSRRYGDMVEALSKHSQLILITHNRETMSRAGIIYGVTMGSTGVSKLLSIQFEEAVQVAK